MGSGSLPRIGIRLATLATAGAALTALTACGAPAQPEPPSGHPATLSADVFAYDNPEFLTNRKPLLTPTAECSQIPTDVLTEVGIKPSNNSASHEQLTDGGCMVRNVDGRMNNNQLSITIGAATWDFDKFWRGDVKFTGEVTTGGGPPGNAGYTGATSLRRMIIDNRYYAVMYVSPEVFAWDGCVLAIDTGSPNPLLVASSTSTMNSQPKPEDTKRILDNDCPRTQDIAQKLLARLDPDGGSRRG